MSAPIASPNIRVLSYNIHKGFTLGNLNFVLHEIRQSLREINPDVLCLQEVSGDNQNHRNRFKTYPLDSQFEFLAEQVWPHFAYGKNAVYQHGHHGNAILSRYPIAKWDNLDLSTNRFESRGLLHANIQVPGNGSFHVLTTHLNLLEGGRRRQLDKICGYLSNVLAVDSSAIFAGDFNDWREVVGKYLHEKIGFDEAFLRLAGKHPKTFPAFFPRLGLDRIFYKNLNPVSADVLGGGRWKNLSDHLPLLAEFSF
jgi:endonuclease/exonuclease/phosphatase family metal-dependent hydrolase